MSKNEILAELPRLTKSDRAEIRGKIAELDEDGWLESEPLTNAEKSLLDARLPAYEADSEAGSSWSEVEARLHAQLKK